jgi:hypothetical protein
MPIEPTKVAITRDPILVDFALQGGGSHGAFTWGVLDRLLEEQWLGIDGISGTSAGAMKSEALRRLYCAHDGCQGMGPSKRSWNLSTRVSRRWFKSDKLLVGRFSKTEGL